MSTTQTPSELEHVNASVEPEEQQESNVQGTQQRPRLELTSVVPALTVLALEFVGKDLPLFETLGSSLGNGSH